MALTRLFIHDTFYDATDNFTYTPGMRLTLDNTTQSARITRLQNSGVVSTDETIDPSGVAFTGGTIDGTVIGATTPAAGTFTTITVDTSTLVVDAANNRVGIGTTSPSHTLDVVGEAEIISSRNYTGSTPGSSSYALAAGGSGSGQVGIGQHNALPSLQGFGSGTGFSLHINPAAGNVLIANGGGNVGIGTTSLGAKLHVNGTVRLQNLPTSASGLSAGDLWNNSGVINIA